MHCQGSKRWSGQLRRRSLWLSQTTRTGAACPLRTPTGRFSVERLFHPSRHRRRSLRAQRSRPDTSTTATAMAMGTTTAGVVAAPTTRKTMTDSAREDRLRQLASRGGGPRRPAARTAKWVVSGVSGTMFIGGVAAMAQPAPPTLASGTPAESASAPSTIEIVTEIETTVLVDELGNRIDPAALAELLTTTTNRPVDTAAPEEISPPEEPPAPVEEEPSPQPTGRRNGGGAAAPLGPVAVTAPSAASPAPAPPDTAPPAPPATAAPTPAPVTSPPRPKSPPKTPACTGSQC